MATELYSNQLSYRAIKIRGLLILPETPDDISGLEPNALRITSSYGLEVYNGTEWIAISGGGMGIVMVGTYAEMQQVGLPHFILVNQDENLQEDGQPAPRSLYLWNGIELLLIISKVPDTIEGTLATPGSLTATAVGSSQIDLVISAVTNATSYTIEMSTDPTFSSGTVAIYTGGSLTYNKTGLTPSTHYYFRAKAMASGYNDSGYAFADATPIITSLSTPTVSVTPVNDTDMDILLSTVSGATTYVVQRSLNGASGWITVYSGSSVSFTDTGLDEETTYYYRAKAQATGYTDSGFGTGNATTGSVDFDPATVPNQKVIWDLTDAATVTAAGGNLTALEDKSTSNNDLVFPSGLEPAYFATGGANNLPYAQVLASGKLLGRLLATSLSTPITVYAVVQIPQPLSNGDTIFYYDGIGGLDGVNSADGAYRWYLGVPPYYSNNFSNASRPQWTVLKFTIKSTTEQGIEVNKEPFEIGTPNYANNGGTAISFPQLVFNQPNMKVAEVRLVNGFITESDDIKMRSYLMSKFNILPPTKIILAFGDSHTAGVQAGTASVGPYMRRMKVNAGFSVINWGISGSVVNTIDYPQTPGSNLEDLYNLFNKPRYSNVWLHFQYGTNDAAIETANHTVMADWKADYKAYIQSYIDAGFDPNKIIICTPPYSSGAYVNGKLDDFLALIDQIATEMSIQKADFYREVFDAGLDCGTVAGGDNIHGNDAIHQVMYETLVAITGS